MNRSERNRLIEANLPLVGHLVNEVCAKATQLPREDMAGVGALALTTAAESFDASLGVPFGAFARRRVKGAMQDEMRSMDWASARTRKRIKETVAVREHLTTTLGRAPTDDEVGATMGTETTAVATTLAYASRRLTHLDESAHETVPDGSMTPEDRLVVAERVHFIRQGVQSLPERLRQVVVEHFFLGRSVGEIAKDLGLTHGAVSHRKSEALTFLREGLHTHYEPDGADAGTAAHRRQQEYLAHLGEVTAGGITRAKTPALLDSTAA